jgi:hypothetical protein
MNTKERSVWSILLGYWVGEVGRRMGGETDQYNEDGKFELYLFNGMYFFHILIHSVKPWKCGYRDLFPEIY